MRTVEDDDGRRYVVLKESADSSRVLDISTGREQYVENNRLNHLAGAPALENAARGIPEEARRLITSVQGDRSLGLLVWLDASGPVQVRRLMEGSDFCESDLHGLLGEFHAAGLVEETTIEGERAYDVTDSTRETIRALKDQGGGPESHADSPE